MLLISSCLVGEKCRYDGTGQTIQRLKEIYDAGEALKVCPEVLGGMTTPRNPCEIREIDGRRCVVDKEGNDFTLEFEKGAQEVLRICKENNLQHAVLKARSPSCGCGQIYDGSFQKKLVEGNGLTVELLLANNVKVYTEENYE